MITLNSDKGLVLVERWDDITIRPGFDGNLDPTAIELESILGSYAFGDYIICGLSSCRQPHGKGYLVKAKNGRETNIGKDCGRKHFGVDFETLRKTYDRDLLNATRRQRLGEFQNRAQLYLDTIDRLRRGQIGADWVYRTSRALVSKTAAIPDEIVHWMSGMAKARGGSITRQRQATEQEVDDIEARENRRVPRPHYVSESIGMLQGLAVLFPENDLRQILVVDLIPKLVQLKQLSVDTMREADLASWDKWAAGIDQKLDQAKEVIHHGTLLLSKSNLAQLDELLEDQADRKIFGHFISKLPV
ncbi:MAG: hypothetical protein M3Z41_05545 [Candidatus Eremiobacteraeota bacterium]|nr:hypothetical protein [Candidatus Eremiobacteraeota bacterium]